MCQELSWALGGQWPPEQDKPLPRAACVPGAGHRAEPHSNVCIVLGRSKSRTERVGWSQEGHQQGRFAGFGAVREGQVASEEPPCWKEEKAQLGQDLMALTDTALQGRFQ